MDSFDWSNGIRYHTFGTRSDTEFKKQGLGENVLDEEASNNMWRPYIQVPKPGAGASTPAWKLTAAAARANGRG
jgi:hypothetical protein